MEALIHNCSRLEKVMSQYQALQDSLEQLFDSDCITRKLLEKSRLFAQLISAYLKLKCTVVLIHEYCA